MLQNKHLGRCIILLLLLYSLKTHKIFGHEGHDHSSDIVTVERPTLEHLKSLLSSYLGIYNQLVQKESTGMDVLAQRLLDAAVQGAQTEPDGPGRHMMEHIGQGAAGLKEAKTLAEIQEAFASISEAISPFFSSWPNQLKHNKLRLYYCNTHRHHWLQPQDHLPLCPYASSNSQGCQDIVEVCKAN